MIEEKSKPDKFNEWDGMYTVRKALKLDIIEPQVSIIDRLNFVIYLKILSNIIKHF